jgi:hypothetical protein
VALFVALGGTTYAAIPSPDGKIKGCYQKHGGNLRVIDPSKHCGSREKPLLWNQRGPAFAAEQGNPPPTGGSIQVGQQSLNVPVSGQLLVIAQWDGGAVTCGATASCSYDVGLYPDGVPVSGADHKVSLAHSTSNDSNDAVTMVGMVQVAAGVRHVQTRVVLNSGPVSSVGGGIVSNTAVLLD